MVLDAARIGAGVGADCTVNWWQPTHERNIGRAFFETIVTGIATTTAFLKFGGNRIFVEGVG